MKSTSSIDMSDAEALLLAGLTDVWIKLNAKYIEQLKHDFKRWLENDVSSVVLLEPSLTKFMSYKVTSTAENIAKLKRRSSEFNRRYLRSADKEEQLQHILEFSADMGASKQELKKDKRAFGRWFDREAIIDRFNAVLAAEQQCLAFYLDRFGWVYSVSIAHHESPEVFWERHPIESIVQPLFVFEGDNRVRVAAFHCVARALHSLPYDSHEKLISDASLKYIYRAALDSRQDVLIQREALSLLGSISVETLQVALDKRLKHPHAGDDYFVRRHSVSLLGEYKTKLADVELLLSLAASDDSPAVRQVVAAALLDSSVSFISPLLHALASQDKVAAVRGASILSLLDYLHDDTYFELVLDVLKSSIDTESDAFVLKVILKVGIDALLILDDEKRTLWINTILPCIESLHVSADRIEVRRLSAQAREWFWLYGSTQAINLYQQLLSVVADLQEGKAIKLSADISYQDDLQLARVLSLIAQNDHGFSMEQGMSGRFIRKGDRFKFRFWRFIHEIRNASTDKRQAHRHTTGRHFFGLLRAPSALMCELAETKVPGEPLFIANEGGWRPYLPLVDDILSCLDQGWPAKPYQIVTSEGVTQVMPPAGLWTRLKAQAKLTFGFEHYARKRNWINSSQGDPGNYISALEQLGFSISYTPHDHAGSSEDAGVRRFFPAMMPLNLEAIAGQTKDYFFSVYENTLFHLAIFVVLVSGYFFGRHIYLNRCMRKARNSIPLVIGGWGTRGKSGTERLKAALFNALGYSVVSKTSGCEAMFLHSPAYGELREMFLFRPYDKATIWEQMDVVRLSAKLDCEVFLWECMGLTPSYVHVLQKDWMRDDIATITNTYPDHEDLQGPAGHEIPRVMTNFIPRSSVLVTTEEQMLPVLRESAKTFDTKLISVGWLEAGLLTPDVLERFPYEEHPYNIALVLAIAKELGIEKDFALKEMADRVVADLGVLKTYPLATIDTRRLEFVMGMSANERFGALGNWTRMEFDQHALSKDPEVWVTTVVNNRSDRVPRSRVFATIIAADVAVDRHILIGGNLHGLKSYVHDAWNDQLSTMSLFDQSQQETAEQRLQAAAKKFRVPVSETEVRARFVAMLNGIGVTDTALHDDWDNSGKVSQLLAGMELSVASEEIVAALAHDLSLWHQYQDFLERLQTDSNEKKLQADFNALAWSWLEAKIIIVEDYYASGNDVIDFIVAQTPPGLKARIMGMQNIKGTGLDYVYRWQAWESCYQACQKMLSDDHIVAEAGVKVMSQFKEYGPLCQEKVLTTIAQVTDRGWAQNEEIQAELTFIVSNMEQALKKIQHSDANEKVSSDWSVKLAGYLEAFLDAGDAVKRRKRANQIYQDLQNKRISHDRAAMELQALNKRQKGGWAGEYFTRIRRTK